MADPPAPTVVVLGSVHMDLIAHADRLPGPGKSVVGDEFMMAPGGKGGNQACQFALAGAHVHMVTVGRRRLRQAIACGIEGQGR